MRAVTTLLVCVLLASPLAAGVVTSAPAAAPVASVASAAFDPTDAELMLLLARLDHPRLVPLARPNVAPGGSLEEVLSRVASRAEAPVAAEDLAAFGSLDPAVRAPLVTLFVAIEAAWDAYDVAAADLSQDEIAELALLHKRGEIRSARATEIAGEIDQETLIAAAIMLTDVVESIVIPQLQAAADSGLWPAGGAWDPVGVLRLGSTGSDVEELDRIVQIDPRGDDVYRNNAGASTIVDPAFESNWNIVAPFGISIDLAGDDRYEDTRDSAVMGSSVTGIGYGLLVEVEGDDVYHCDAECLGSGLATVRERSGSDSYRSTWEIAVGYGSPLAVLRDDSGIDNFTVGVYAGGHANFAGALGLLWDRNGADMYASGGSDQRYGWGNQGGRGWLVDEGAEDDTYETAVEGPMAFRHGCNDCTWEIGSGLAGEAPGGQGNDNRGGLAHLLARQDPIIRQLT